MPSISAVGNPTTLLISSTLTLTNSLKGGVWSSTNPNIASVNSNTGVVTGVAVGSVTITYTICNKSTSYTLTVILEPKLTSTSLHSFSYCTGCTITPQSITVSGENLRSNVNLTTSTGYQISTSSNGTYSSSVILTPNVGTLTNTNIFVKVINSLSSTPSGILSITSIGAISKTITLTSNTDNALNFDGNDYVTIADNNALDLNSNYTIEAWIKPTSFSSFAGIVSKYQTSGSNGYNLKLSGTDNFSGISFDGVSTSNDALSLNKWYHIAGVNNNGTRKIYINGVEQSISGTPITTAINTDPVMIGQDLSSTGGRFFKGSIDEVRIWNTARTANEIASNMSVALSGAESGLVAYYNFDQGIANGTNTNTTSLLDNTTNALAGTISGMTLTGSSSNFVEGFMPSITSADSTTVLLKGKTLALSNILTSGVWSSTNSNIATVNNNGLVTAVTAGNVSITYSVCGKTTAYNLEVSVITTSGTFTTFAGCFGVASASQSILVNAVSLTNNLVVTAPAGYEVARNSVGDYSSSISLTPINGTISNTAIYVRLSSKAFNGDHGNLVLSSGSAKSMIVPIGIASIRLVEKVKLKINSDAPNDKICSEAHTNVTFTAKAENTGLNSNYQWKLNGVNVGINSATYSNSSLSDHDVVSVVLTADNTFCLGPVTSNPVTIYVYSIPATPTTITGINNLCAGSNSVYKVDGVQYADGYEWIVSGNLINVNNTNNVINTISTKNAGIGAIKVRAVNFCGRSDYSTEYNVIISNTPGPKAYFNILNNNICIGTGPINFADSSAVNDSTKSPITSYNWNFGDGSLIVNTQNASRDYQTDGGHDVIMQIQTQDNCLASVTKSANIDRLSVSGNIIPNDSIICIGSKTILSLVNYFGSIQWMSKDSTQTEWTAIKGATSDTLNTGNLYVNKDYRADVKSGSCSVAITTPISIKVKVAPTITITPPSPVSDTATSFSLPYKIITGTPNSNVLTDTGSNRMPNFNNNIWYALRESPLSVLLPKYFNKTNVKGIYGFKISAVELPYCLNSEQALTFSLWVGIPKLTYNSPNVFKIGDTIKPIIPVTENLLDLGSSIKFTTVPTLPAGLTINGSGVISGIASAVSTVTSYEVSATISSSTITSSVIISVYEDKPDSLKYTTPNIFILGKKITDSLKPIYKGGKIRNYAINKPLPAGLTIDSTTGVISGTPTATLSKTSFIITGSNTAGSTSSTVVITVATMPITPSVKNARYIVGKPGLPSDIRSLVNPLPSGIVPAWYNDTTKNWTTTAPKTKTIIGKYIYQVKAYDTTNQIYSTSYVNDTIILAPDVPNVFDSTYLSGIKTNPINISVQVSGLTGASYNYYYNGTKQSSTPLLANISGNKKYAVSQTINNVESDTAILNVTVLDPNNIIHLQKIVDSGVLQSNLSYNFTFKLIVTNLTDLRLSNIIISDNLHNYVPISSEYHIVRNTATGGLKVNKYFNGNNNINLTLDSSTLAPYAKDTLTLVMNLEPKGFTGAIKNIAAVNATTKWGTITMESSSLTKATETSKTPTNYNIKEFKIFIPEGFSPNNDGINDYFIIVKPFNTKIDLEIYNRSGKIVYKNINYSNNWNGKGNYNNSERELEDDGYYYSIKATDESGRVQVFKGFVLIQR
jgi:gliding motility-associated-like protein